MVPFIHFDEDVTTFGIEDERLNKSLQNVDVSSRRDKHIILVQFLSHQEQKGSDLYSGLNC